MKRYWGQRILATVGQIERKTQERIVELFRDTLGYEYAGSWDSRPGNAQVETVYLEQNLRARGYTVALINKALDEIRKAASLGGDNATKAV